MPDLDVTFNARIAALQQYCAAASSSYRGQNPGAWAVPDNIASTPIMVPTTLTPAYNRDQLNTNYAKALNTDDKGNSTGGVIAMSRQICFIAMEERAARLRYASPARIGALAYGRTDGHSNKNGVFGKMTIAAVNANKAGSAAGIVPGDAPV